MLHYRLDGAYAQAELRKAGYRTSERTIRQALKRLGFRWKRPKYMVGKPDHESKKGK